MEAHRTNRLTGRDGFATSRESLIGIGATLLAIAAMAVDHLMGDDPGLEDPPMFVIASGLSLALLVLLFGWVVPRAKLSSGSKVRDGLVFSVLAVVPGIATVWLGLPFVLAGAGVALGLSARENRRTRRASAAIVIGGLALLAGTVGYAALAIDKLEGSGSDSPDFAAADLAGLSFAREELRGLEYQTDSSGPGAFVADQKEEAREEGDRSGLEFVTRLEQLGLEADHVAQFFATSRRSEVTFVESIVFLFDEAKSAEAAITDVSRAAARNVAPAAEIDTPALGEQPFGIRGEFDGFLTYTFGWRVGDAIQMLTVAPQDRDAGPNKTLQLARRLRAKAE